jgi:Capsule polysaccharide biosynthesis protein
MATHTLTSSIASAGLLDSDSTLPALRRPRAIVFEFNTPMLIETLALLSKQYGWEPAYIVSTSARELVKHHFPAAIYQESPDARYCRPVPELPDIKAPAIIDQPLAETMAYAGVTALKQMDRMELLGGFPLHERIQHFHRVATYWSAVLERLRPDVILSITAPHVVYDYVAYMLARQRGIRTVLFEYVTTEGLLMAIDKFEDGLPPLITEYRRLLANPRPQPAALSERMEAYWQRLKGSYDQAAPALALMLWARAEARRMAAKQAEDVSQAATLQPAPRVAPPMQFFSHLGAALKQSPSNPFQFLRAVFDAARQTLQPPPPLAVPLARPEPPPVDGAYNGHFYDLAPKDLAQASAEYRRSHGEKMKRRYDELAVSPDLTRPYIYVALHMQPERSTNPNGGVFDNQDVMIGMIAAALPAGWCVYVKEHPSQYLDGVRVERGRWGNFYDAIVAHPNVALVPSATPSFELIDNARAVASVTGTSSWEAIARGLPALVFGEAWYKGCEGAHTVRTAKDCRQALARIAAGERPDPEKVRLFLQAVDNTAFTGYLDDDEKSLVSVAEADNIARLAHAIAECYEASLRNEASDKQKLWAGTEPAGS